MIANLVGANGVGKSTLLRLLAGLIQPHSGSVEYGNGWTDLRRLYIPCGLLFYSNMTLGQNLRLFADLYGAQRFNKAANAVLYQTGLEASMKEPVAQLSSGQIQAAALTLLFIVKPHVVFMDEPFVHLDVNTRRYFSGLFVNLANAGTTLILTEVSPSAQDREDQEVTISVSRNPVESLP